MEENLYDAFRCSVDYEGDANLPFVTYEAYDGYSEEWPYNLDFDTERSNDS